MNTQQTSDAIFQKVAGPQDTECGLLLDGVELLTFPQFLSQR